MGDGGLARIDEESGAAHGAVVGLAHVRRERAGRVEVGSGLEPFPRMRGTVAMVAQVTMSASRTAFSGSVVGSTGVRRPARESANLSARLGVRFQIHTDSIDGRAARCAWIR
jgi:hypothetical protein